MELLNNFTYLLCVFLFLEIQRCFCCSNPCPCQCTPTPLPPLDYSNDNIFPIIPNYNPLLLSSELDPFSTGQKNFGLNTPSPFPNVNDKDPEAVKAYSCSLINCFDDDKGAVCACNYNTGNVVSFKNKCQVEKHNCRFNTAFHVILDEICPWEFESRRTNREFEVDLTDPKYYN